MSINIQTSSGLKPISPSLTKENIIGALGYTPADNSTFYEDGSGALYVADGQGYIIAKIDANGLTTTKVSATAIALNDVDLASKLEELENKVPDIDLSNYYTKEEVQNEISKIEIDNIPEIDLSEYALQYSLDQHATDLKIHINQQMSEAWNNKSEFSGDYNDLRNLPNITTDEEDNALIVCDPNGNVIMKADASGLNISALYINGRLLTFPEYTDEDEGKVLTIVNGVPTWV